MNTNSRSIQTVTDKRLRVGAAVVAGSEVTDTTLVAARLAAFTEAYRAYVEAERKVGEVEARCEAEKLKLAQLGAEHDDAVERLACCLSLEGQPRVNPFAAYDIDSPGNIKRMPPAEAAPQVRTLLAALGRASSISTATREAAERLTQATERVELALGPVQTLQDEVAAARRMSDVVGSRFDRALSNLRLATRIAANDGAPGLHAALFPPSRGAKKATVAPEAPTVTEQPAAAPPA